MKRGQRASTTTLGLADLSGTAPSRAGREQDRFKVGEREHAGLAREASLEADMKDGKKRNADQQGDYKKNEGSKKGSAF